MELDDLFKEIYERLLRLFPEFATRAGDHRYNHLLSDPSPAGHAQYEEAIRGFLEKLQKIDSRQLPVRHRTNYDLCRLWFLTEVEGFPFNTHLLILDPLQGFQISIPNLVNDMPFENVEDCQRCLERISRFPTYLNQATEATRESLRRNVLQAKPAVEKVISQLDLQLGMAAVEHPLFKPFTKFPPSIPDRARDSIRSQALMLIEEQVIPALGRFRKHLNDEYLPRARNDAGIWSLPNGSELYAWLVRQSTTTKLSPEEIHQRGIAEVERILKELEAVKNSTKFTGTLQEFFSHLRTEPGFYFQKEEDLLSGYRDIAKRADAELPRFFGKLPRTPYGVLPVPDYAAATSTAAYYLPPPTDGSRPGYFYANTHDLPSRPRFEMEALTLHEAVPGHHLQMALQIELKGLPQFRTRWLSFTSFVEGWGLYAERLGKEMGFYTDPYSEFGRLTYEMWRACRLVVDTGIHHLRWTRDQSIDYLMENSSLSRLNVESEVDRYIVWPGQALAYKIGELKILELRRHAEKEIGPAFNLKDFHDRILEEGSLPLDLLARKVDVWIRSRKRVKR